MIYTDVIVTSCKPNLQAVLNKVKCVCKCLLMKIMNVELSNVSAVGAAAGQGSEAAIMFGSKLVQT